MKWLPAEIGDKLFDLTHLHPFEWEMIVPGKHGKPEQRYTFEVIFSLHCFTRGKADGAYAAELEYRDSRETRLFDVERYELSFRLPDIIKSIGQRKCFHTGHSNFFTIEIVDASGAKVEYAVYFKVSRASRRGWLNLYVESAYLQRNIPRSKPSPRKPIGFHVIAFNVLNKKVIKTQK